MKNRIKENITKIQEEIIESNVKTESKQKKQNCIWRKVTEEDAKKHDKKIDLTFKKCFDEEKRHLNFSVLVNRPSSGVLL